ncbi:TraB/GumN family protein [Haloferula sp. BvORR071]|uniref:TraB/GumN family protein n=1 Tax=Haloferula sp. BvORR071 TaxID=1396141 RepID=UPI002240FC73|nr:TraB/GumN family protein [Haloferula sp. BvORR071]
MIRTFAAAVAGCALLCSAQGEDLKHPVKPLLWKIEGEKVKKPSYLFGTIHVGKGPASNLHPAAVKAFAEATVIHTEAPMDAASQLGAAELVMRGDGSNLADSIGPEIRSQLDAELKQINPALDSEILGQFKTWYVAITLPLLKLQLEGSKPLDMQLWERAEREGKKTAGMQTIAEQLAGFNSFNENDQVALLSETLRSQREDREAKRDSIQLLIDAYLTGDTQKIVAEFERSFRETIKGEHKELGERLIKLVLKDRDVIMADYMDATLKKSPEEIHFFAAGAAHFAAGDSVRSLLEKKGYKVTRVE